MTITEEQLRKARCLLCDAPLTERGVSRWSVCEDAHYFQNVWGGDSHEYIGFLCNTCGERIKQDAKQRGLLEDDS